MRSTLARAIVAALAATVLFAVHTESTPQSVHSTLSASLPLPPLTGHVKLMLAGDSTAQGYPIACGDGTFYGERAVLGDWFVKIGKDVEFVGGVTNSCGAPWNHTEGRAGETIFHLADTIGGYLTARPAEVLILRVGVNDATSWSGWHTAEQMAIDYTRLIDNARLARPTIRIVASEIIPPDGAVSADLAKASVTARKFNALLPAIVAPYGDSVHIVHNGKITPVWLTDGLHPTGQGYVGLAWFLIEQPDGLWPWLSADPPPALRPWDVVLDPWR
jgi:GDSL-like lipase/acylhydrolase family protein